MGLRRANDGAVVDTESGPCRALSAASAAGSLGAFRQPPSWASEAGMIWDKDSGDHGKTENSRPVLHRPRPGPRLHLLLPTDPSGVGMQTSQRRGEGWASAGDTREGIFCHQAGMQWGPGGPEEGRPGRGDSGCVQGHSEGELGEGGPGLRAGRQDPTTVNKCVAASCPGSPCGRSISSAVTVRAGEWP